jgi:hypothetical protein
MSDAVDVSGHCYCGAITYRVRIPEGREPVFTAYCHCESCRRAHAAPLYQVVGILEEHFEFTRGADELNDFRRPNMKMTRGFCRQCGTRILNHFDTWQVEGKKVMVFFPNTLEAEHQNPWPELLRPRKNAYAADCVLDWDKLLEARDAG